MMSAIRSFLISAGIILAVVLLQPRLHAQGFGGMFSGFQMNGITNDEEDTTEITSDSADIDLANNVITLIGNVTVDDGTNVITCNKMEIYLEEDAADTLVGTAEKPAGSDSDQQKKQGSESAEAGDGENSTDESPLETEEEEKKNIKRIVCIGDVVCTKKADKDDPDGQDQVAMSGRAEFDVQKEIILMTEAHSDLAGKLSENVYGSMQQHLRGSILANYPVMTQGDNWMVGESFTVFVKENNRTKVRDMRFNYVGSSLFTEEAEEKTNSSSSTLISTKDADIDLENNRITLTGEVDVDEQFNKVTCNKMVITLAEKESAEDIDIVAASVEDELAEKKDIESIVCTGDVVFLKRSDPDESEREDQIAMSDRADYDAVKEVLDMTGKPVLMQGSNRLYGSHIKVFLKEDNRMEVDAAKANLAGKLLSSDNARNASGIPITTVTAKRADILPNDKITLSQNVVVDDGTGKITCAKMEIFMQKDSQNSLLSLGDQPDKTDADGKDDNEISKDISKIVCSGNVVYRKQSDSGQEQVVLAQKADYDATNEIIVMTGSHTAPEGEIPQETYAEIKRMFEKDNASSNGNAPEQYSILMQGSSWVAGTPIKIYPKEGNRIIITAFKSGLRQGGRSRDSQKGNNK